jgi:hypothetical protein
VSVIPIKSITNEQFRINRLLELTDQDETDSPLEKLISKTFGEKYVQHGAWENVHEYRKAWISKGNIQCSEIKKEWEERFAHYGAIVLVIEEYFLKFEK